MIKSPFPLLRQFQDLVDLSLLTREDNVSCDEDIVRLTGLASIVSLRQMHGNTAVRVHSPSSRVLEADALATDVPGITVTIRFADCQNAVIIDPKERIICLVHVGWRGVRSKMMANAYEFLRAEWNIDPASTFVGLGPALCAACSDFTDPLTEVPELKNFTHGRTIDLRAALDDELASLGVLKQRIDRMEDCTRCHPETYFTYRGGDREKVSEGHVNCFAATIRT